MDENPPSSWESAVPEEPRRQIQALIASKRPLPEINAEVARVLPPVDAAAVTLKKTTCERCKCDGFRTCIVWVFHDGRWLPQVVYLEPCGIIATIVACIRQFFTR